MHPNEKEFIRLNKSIDIMGWVSIGAILLAIGGVIVLTISFLG